jgi:hypothetical protein
VPDKLFLLDTSGKKAQPLLPLPQFHIWKQLEIPIKAGDSDRVHLRFGGEIGIYKIYLDRIRSNNGTDSNGEILLEKSMVKLRTI